MDDALREEVAYCEEVTRRYSRSFYFSTGFLPPTKRQAIRVLYAFSRFSDNIVDEGTDPISARLVRLEAWRTQMYLPSERQEHPVLRAWADARRTFAIPIRYSEELLDGMRMDLEQTRYQTFEQLRRYCYCVASTVGLNSMYVIGFEDCPETFQRAEELGVALQLTNILRDIGEDWERGRIYLPQEDLDRFGYTEYDLARGVVDERYRNLMDFEIERARSLYERSWDGIVRLDKDGRFAVAAAVEVYRGILNKLIASGYDNYHRRAFLSSWEKLLLLPRVWWRVRSLNKLRLCAPMTEAS